MNLMYYHLQNCGLIQFQQLNKKSLNKQLNRIEPTINPPGMSEIT